jgi:hypothetical protein
MYVVRGRVVGSQGDSAAEAAIHVISSPLPMPDIAQLADDEGKFALGLPKAGRYRIGARSEKWGKGSTEVTVGDEESIFLEIRLDPNETNQ